MKQTVFKGPPYTELDVDVFAIDSTLYEMSIRCILYKFK